MTQAGAKGPAVPAKPAAAPAAKAASPAAPAVAPKAPPPQSPANTAVTPKATAPVAPRKGPPPLPPESGPDLHARAAEPMRPRFETAPGVGSGHAADAPRAPMPAAISRDEIDAMIRKAVSDGVAAVVGELNQTTRTVFALERRIAELEQRPVAAVAPPPPAATYAVQPAQPAQPGVRAAATPAASAIPVSFAPTPVLDVRAIERDVNIVVDSALDGSRRKRNLVIVVVLFILVVFGGLFALLAESYSHKG